MFLAYDRADQAFSKDVQVKPPRVATSIKEVSDAGVHVVVCRIALE